MENYLKTCANVYVFSFMCTTCVRYFYKIKYRTEITHKILKKRTKFLSSLTSNNAFTYKLAPLNLAILTSLHNIIV